MKQTFFSLGVAGVLLTLLLGGFWGLVQHEVVPHLAQTLAAPHSPAPLSITSNGLTLTAQLGTNPSTCGAQPTLDVRVGAVVYYCYTIRNGTTQTLDLHTLDAPVAGDLWRDVIHEVAPNSTLNPRTSHDIIFSRTVLTPGALIEEATWKASKDSFVVTATATTTIHVIGPLNVGLTLGRTPACASTTNLIAPQNGRLFYCLTIHNTTGVTLTDYTINLPLPRFQTNLLYVLPPTSRLVLTEGLLSQLGINLSLGQAITQARESTVTVTAQAIDGNRFSGAAKVGWQIGSTSITLRKTIGLRDSATCPASTNVANVARDTPIYYCLRVTNSGAVTLTNHSFAEFNPALGSAPINGQFTYPLAPGRTITLTRANITSTPGLVYTTLPVLGPFSQPVTATNTLVYTATNTTGFQATASATSTLRLAGPVYALTFAANSADNNCILGNAFSLEVGQRIWFCLRVVNIGPIELTTHSFQLLVSPPSRQGTRYNYIAAGSFTQPLPPNGVMTLTNQFLSTKGLGATLMGPYTLTVPLTNTNKITGTITLTSTNPNLGQQLVVRATNNTINLASFATATLTPTPTPLTTETFTPIPGLTPTPTFTPSPTPITPTPTPIIISPLPTPIPTPDLFVSSNVSAPASQPGQPESPVATPSGFDSPLATPPLDPAFVAATQTTDAALTATAFATLQPPTPTFTETPTATPTPTETPTATPTATATPTQRPIAAPTATAPPSYGATLPGVLQSVVAVAGWIWLMIGVLAFFISAGIVAGMGLRHRGRTSYQLDPPVVSPTPPTASQRPRPAPEDDNWPASLP